MNTLCLTGIQPLSTAEQRVLSSFGAAGSLLVTLYGLLSVMWFIGVRLLPSDSDFVKKVDASAERLKKYIIGMLLTLVPICRFLKSGEFCD